MARLDRLGPAKEVAQIGAAIGREFSHALFASVVGKPEAELASALDRLIHAGLLFRQGAPPLASYLFKHALVQDAAYGTLLREPRRALHARIAEALENQFAEIAESRPGVLAHHYAEAGLIEKAVGRWGKAGQLSLGRSALVEAAAQFTRALDLIATLPGTPALRREQIRLQVALITPVMHVKGYAAPETRAAAEQARLLIERAEALGEPPEDPLLLFSVLYGFFAANLVKFNGDALRELAAQFLALAEKQEATVPLMIVGHRLVGSSSLLMGDIADGRRHLDQAIALYDPAGHRSLATRFGQDAKVTSLSFRSLALWLLGYPEPALRDADDALKMAREIGQAPTLMFALIFAGVAYIDCRNYAAATAVVDEVVVLADEKSAAYFKAFGLMLRGSILASASESLDAVRIITSGLNAYRSTGAATLLPPFCLSSHERGAHAAARPIRATHRRCIGEAMTVGGEPPKETLARGRGRTESPARSRSLAPEPDAAKAQACFEQRPGGGRARAAGEVLGAARRDEHGAGSGATQGKRDEARELLAPVYGWFTEGFETLDLRDAKTLLDALDS